MLRGNLCPCASWLVKDPRQRECMSKRNKSAYWLTPLFVDFFGLWCERKEISEFVDDSIDRKIHEAVYY